MPWHELKLLKWKEDDEKEREKPKLSTASNSTSFHTPPRQAKSPQGLKPKIKKKKRDPLLGKLSVDLEYLEGDIETTYNFFWNLSSNDKESCLIELLFIVF